MNLKNYHRARQNIIHNNFYNLLKLVHPDKLKDVKLQLKLLEEILRQLELTLIKLDGLRDIYKT